MFITYSNFAIFDENHFYFDEKLNNNSNMALPHQPFLLRFVFRLINMYIPKTLFNTLSLIFNNEED